MFDDELKELGNALAQKDERVRELGASLKDRNQHIQRLKGEVADIETAIAQKDERVRELEASLEDRNQHIQHLEGEVTEIRNAIVQRGDKIREIEMENWRINSELDSIKASVTWRTVMKWQSFIERSIPQGTRRRRYYDLSLIGLRTITNEGWSSFWWKYKQHRSSKKHTELIAKSTEEKILETAQDKTELSEKSLDTFMRYKLLHFLSQPGVSLSFPKFEEPIVSIITLTFNKAEFTYQYLESILAHTDISYELILVDNGSQDETNSLFDRLENVTVIKNKENLGFIKGCNQGASKARGKYLLFLNNDIIVTPGWLSKLVKTIENYPKCGAVGCKLIWPNGKLQEAGSIIWNDGSALGYGREGNPMHPEYSYLREVDYCSGACLLVRKDIFQQLGLFDERYGPAYYEDSDLCLGIWGLGYKVVFQPDVVVFHHEFTSSSFDKATALMAANQSKLVAKWKDTLKNKLDSSPNNVLFARDLRPGNRILVIDDRVPTPYQGAGYPRADRMLKFLGDLAYKVTFFPLDNTTPWQPFTHRLQQLGIEVFYGDNLDFIRFAQDRAGYYDLVLVSRPHNMEMVVDAIKRSFPNAVLLYDAEAMFSIREILKAKAKGIKLKDEDSERMINNEINLMKRADMVITISENERRMIVEREKLDNIAVWGHPIDVRNPKNDFHERKDILFVGGFFALESPNEDAVLYFAKEVFPKIQKELSCRLFIVGINPPDSVKKLSSSSVIVTGFVPDLREYYEKCRAFVVPHRYSAGIPWKLQEAMSYGIPSVVSELTASQLDLTDGNEVLIAKNAEELAQKIITVYQDEKLWHQIQQNTLEYIKDTCNPEILKTTLNKIIMKGLETKNKRYSKEDFKDKPKISIITPVWDPDEKWLRLAIESVINQIYDNWELCIAVGDSTKPHVRRILENYAKKDKRIMLKFMPENKGIATNSNDALSLATTDFVGFLDQYDELDPFAINEVVNRLNEKPDVEFIYSDDDKIDKKGRRKSPFFKPEWSPDMFLSYNYLSHFTVIKKRLIDKVGGFREGYTGAHDYDLLLRVTEFIDEQKIAHIPKILYHQRLVPGSKTEIGSPKPQGLAAAKNEALTDALTRRGIEGEIMDGLFPGSYRVRYKISGSPKVSIIIPTKDKVNTLKTCIESILEKTDYENYEIIIVDNQSKEEETTIYYDKIKNNSKIKILEYSKPFNFSRINNFAVSQVDTEYILFLNNDTEVIASEWLTALLEHAQRKEVGAVGAKLLYPNNTIQHAGVILTGVIRIAGHAHRHLPASSHGYAGRASIIQNFSAVTAACMLTKKSVFEEVGGFDEINLPVAYNDLDFCLKLRQKGYLIVYTPYAELYHHEYMSRGQEDTPEKLARALKELEYIRKTWGKVLENDPYYNPLSKFDNE
jgi:GT2 family glycosyltransferase